MLAQRARGGTTRVRGGAASRSPYPRYPVARLPDRTVGRGGVRPEPPRLAVSTAAVRHERHWGHRRLGRYPMNGEFAPHDKPLKTDRETPPDVLERLLTRGEVEVVTTASGTILYIPQRLDE